MVFKILFFLFFTSIAFAAELDISKYKGKVVYLDFWASWCGPCKKSFPWLNELQRNNKDIKVIGVNLDKKNKDALSFLNNNKAEFDIIYNPSASLAKKYDVLGMPYSIIFDKEGNEKFKHIGFSDKKSIQFMKELNSLLGKK